MREAEKKKIQNNNQTKRSVRTQRKDNKVIEESGRKPSNAKAPRPKVSHTKPASNSVGSDTNVGTEPSEVYENMVIHYVDDSYRLEDALQGSEASATAFEENDDGLDDHSIDLSKETQQVNGEDSDYESVKDSTSSQGDSQTADDEKIDKAPRLSKNTPNNGSSELVSRASRSRLDHEKRQQPTPNKPVKSNKSKVLAKDSSDHNKLSPSPPTFEGVADKPNEEAHQDVEEGSSGVKSTESDDETAHGEENDVQQEGAALKEKVEMMEDWIEKLEEELREVAALEISLYSVIPEHGSSAHKVHTPARRLSRLYIHACQHWTQNKRAPIAKSTASGLVLVARTCGNDVARLTFWLSNTVVLREIISQAFGISHQLSAARFNESNGHGKGTGGNVSLLKLNGKSGGNQLNKTIQLFEDWQETSTFIAALEKIESWILFRVVESVWWQALTPNMLSPVEDLISQKSIGKLLGPALGDQKQGTFSVELWRNAFQGAFQRLCPVRAAGHECGCLPVLARMVMEHCVARLDVAMFNAILRESANQIPTDPVSDPIVDSRVLPIPAGDLSFGSGAQLKNSVGNWSRWFADSLGMEIGLLSSNHDSGTEGDDHNNSTYAKTKCFCLLNELSELLMLPKDMLMDRSIRKEVCPSISLAVIIRILCNFTPDEFCPDAVPGEVLEALNAENFVEGKLAGDTAGSFPYAAVAVVYRPPSSQDVSEKVAEAGGKPQLERNVSIVKKKGYTSDEELDDLNNPLTSFIEPPSPSMSRYGHAGLKSRDQTVHGANVRYELLREVWSL